MKTLKRVEYVRASVYDAQLTDPFVCEACGAVVVALVKHMTFHQRVDAEYYESDAMLGLTER